MDPMEVASSTISMPPIQTMNRMQNNHPTSRTLPRPMSSEVQVIILRNFLLLFMRCYLSNYLILHA